MLSDIGIRAWIYYISSYKQWWMLKEATPFLLLVLASLPYTFIFSFFGGAVDLTAQWVAWIRMLKLLRYFQIRTYLVN
jgi:hypothetical protein